MNVYRDISLLPKFDKAVITTGSFDGVHSGHVQIIDQLLIEAKNIGGTPIVITFYPHPKKIVQMVDKPLFVLNTPNEKYELLEQNGIENIVVVPFDKSFSEFTADEYISNFLVQKFNPAIIVVGYDHRFGKNREGNFELLKSKEAEFGFMVKEIPEHVLKNNTISSTKIRTAMIDGDIKTAATFLGYEYFFSGLVVEGNKIGRTIGYPTANLLIEGENKLTPANGVYAVNVELEKRKLKGMMNIGVRPTVDGTKRVTEVNIFNFDEDIYGANLKIILKNKLRSEVKFTGLDELKKQLAKDKLMAEEINT
ncbi:MAG: bifunctional riboflavin kinase/FAD synthetase [Ferruginibacter sp.]|nr:bifunctional riboflavin kinase/FAD synthetase [Ferruginibacter sp.]